MYSEIKWFLWLHIHIPSTSSSTALINGVFFEKIVKSNWKLFFHLNECLLTYRCSEKAFLKYTLCIISLDLTFDQLVTQCQTTMSVQVLWKQTRSTTLWSSCDEGFLSEEYSWAFWSSAEVNHKWDDNRVLPDREFLQRQRTVSLLHILSYFRFEV